MALRHKSLLAPCLQNCDSARGERGVFLNVKKKKEKKTARKTAKKSSRMQMDRRRRHRHWQVTVFYADGERFARVYIDRERAQRFAERQKKSPVVKATRIVEVD